ncbi:DUF411 domain-containing protein [Romeriopsis navalis]|nr:DUF411 domain-containing protein [Romeriopsis navalis]
MAKLPWKWTISIAVCVAVLAIGSNLYTSHLNRMTDGNVNASAQKHTILASPIVPQSAPIVSYRSPTCGCCGEWVKRMQAVGFTVEDNITENLDAIKKQHNLPNDLAACHTAIAAGYVIEGHIPAADIQRLLAEKPKIAGIAVPGMPIGSPGMESGNIRESYATYSFTKDGKVTIFQEHPA